MRRFILILLALLLFLGSVAGGVTYALAQNAPCLPGQMLYSLQLRAEKVWALAGNDDPANRAELLLQLFARRLNELEAVLDTDNVYEAMLSTDNAFTEALTAVTQVPAATQPDLVASLARMADRGQSLLGNINTDDPLVARLVAGLDGRFGRYLAAAASNEPELAALLADFSQRAEFAAELLLTPEADAAAAVGNLLNDPRVVPFPPDADISAAHTFFPLVGGHSDLDCTSCHTGTTYSGVDNRCVACHLPDDAHDGGNGSDCAACHTVNNWEDAEFDHTTIGARDCVDCHEPPLNHFEGTCRDCHQDTDNFRNASFNHNTIGGQDCSNCHAPPANHYEGACRDCHQDTDNFRNASFNHSAIGGRDCVSCHAPPANHYEGACRDCHQDTGNFRNASFNHSAIGGQDCAGCHAAPANHYAGTCSNCHGDTTNFRNASFNHAGLTNCQGCHTSPANHFPGQCSQCHGTTTFSGASFSHSFPVNHGNADGDCAACHTDSGNGPASCFLCHNQQSVENEHREEGISNFGNCLSCHANGDEGDDNGEHEDGEDGGEEEDHEEDEGGGEDDNGDEEDEEDEEDD